MVGVRKDAKVSDVEPWQDDALAELGTGEKPVLSGKAECP